VIAVPCCIGNGMAGRLRTAADRVRGLAHSMPAFLSGRLDIVLELVGTCSQACMSQRAEDGQYEQDDRNSRLLDRSDSPIQEMPLYASAESVG
jgi:hypothetical protein